MRLFLAFSLAICLLTAMTGCNESHASATQSQLSEEPIGKVCQVVLDAAWLESQQGFVTPISAREKVGGSKDAAWGKLIHMDDNWIVLDTAIIRIDRTPDGKGSITYGDDGVLEQFEFWIPRDRVLYMRVWAEK